jgi:hypothetical protein
MGRLDRDEGEAQVSNGLGLTSVEIASSLRELQSLFADAEPATQHRIVAALFKQVEVLGPNEIWLYPTIEAEARGWAAGMAGSSESKVRMVGARGFAPSSLTQALWFDLCGTRGSRAMVERLDRRKTTMERARAILRRSQL